MKDELYIQQSLYTYAIILVQEGIWKGRWVTVLVISPLGAVQFPNQFMNAFESRDYTFDPQATLPACHYYTWEY